MSTNEINMILAKLDDLSEKIIGMDNVLRGNLSNGKGGLLAQCQIHREKTESVEARLTKVETKIEVQERTESRKTGIVIGISMAASIMGWLLVNVVFKFWPK